MADLEAVRGLLRRHFGVRAFRPGQAEAIVAALSGRDALVVMPTGAGKSACYQLPALLLPGVTLVVSPLIALQKDQVDRLRHRGVAATFVNSSLPAAEIDRRLAEAAAGGTKLLYLAPERFDNRRFATWLKTAPVSLLAVDEAHCVSEWGHDFRPSYFRLAAARDRLGDVPMIAVTATATPEVRRDVRARLGLRDPVVIIRGFDRPNLRWHVLREERTAGKNRRLVRLLHAAPPGGSSLVYASTRKAVVAVTALLRSNGVAAAAYHAGLPAARRRHVQEAFARGDLPVVVATNAFGLGIDVANIRRVVHYNMPGSLEAYYQEAGRAGRDGEPADCVLLHAYRDRFVHEGFIEAAHPDSDAVAAVWRVMRRRADPAGVVPGPIATWARASGVDPRRVYAAVRILERAGALDRLRGRAACYVRAARRPDGPSADLPEGDAACVWSALAATVGDRLAAGAIVPKSRLRRWADGVERGRRALDRLREARLLDWCDLEREGALRLRSPSADGRDLPIPWRNLEAHRELELAKLRRMERYAYARGCRRAYLLRYFGERARPRCDGCDVCLGAAALTARDEPRRPAPDPAAVRALRALRQQLAEEWALPAYFVLEDRTLLEIARRRPRSADELAEVPDVPPAFLRRAGAAVLEAVGRGRPRPGA